MVWSAGPLVEPPHKEDAWILGWYNPPPPKRTDALNGKAELSYWATDTNFKYDFFPLRTRITYNYRELHKGRKCGATQEKKKKKTANGLEAFSSNALWLSVDGISAFIPRLSDFPQSDCVGLHEVTSEILILPQDPMLICFFSCLRSRS